MSAIDSKKKDKPKLLIGAVTYEKDGETVKSVTKLTKKDLKKISDSVITNASKLDDPKTSDNYEKWYTEEYIAERKSAWEVRKAELIKRYGTVPLLVTVPDSDFKIMKRALKAGKKHFLFSEDNHGDEVYMHPTKKVVVEKISGRIVVKMSTVTNSDKLEKASKIAKEVYEELNSSK